MAVYRDPSREIAKGVESFREDVLGGLSSVPKHLSSKYFYDAEGDKLFQQIMNSEEYYLTNAEYEIFSQQTADLGQVLLSRTRDFDIIELGAGDATKSVHLLEYLYRLKFDFTYYPVDISSNVISKLEKELPRRIPGVDVTGFNGEYLEMLSGIKKVSKKNKLVLFLGANIGNFSRTAALDFLRSVNKKLSPGDLLLIGFDLKKHPQQILSAYDDKEGITRKFNLNLLTRINRELDGDFKIEDFDHYASYDPVSGACRSFLISLREQWVKVSGKKFFFAQHEAIDMELSQKYSIEQTNGLALQSGFRPVEHFLDERGWFLDAVWEGGERVE
jgi:L-histidine Nalpha-methyltransferase